MRASLVNKLLQQKILFITGTSVKAIRSQLMNEDAQIICENAEYSALAQAVREADIVYLYDVDPYYQEVIVLMCTTWDKSFFTRMQCSMVIMSGRRVLRDFDSPVLFYRRSRIFGWQGKAKHALDRILALLALVVLLPVFLAIAIAIKIDDHGPVFYRQTRCTRDDKRFEIYKFRSMRVDSERETGAVLASLDDDRRTRVGKFLRASKLDELPQLINILRGEMSIVGPRPERPELAENAILETPEFQLRTKVKAGLTGYAQVYGYYNTSFEEKLKWDLMYIKEFSLWLDVKLILSTIPSIIRQETSEDRVYAQEKLEIPNHLADTETTSVRSLRRHKSLK